MEKRFCVADGHGIRIIRNYFSAAFFNLFVRKGRNKKKACTIDVISCF